MKLKNIALAITLTTLYSAASFAVGTKVDIKALFAIGTCTGDHAQCPITATINALGDPFNVDPAAVTVNDLGTISAEKKVTISFPAKADEAKADEAKAKEAKADEAKADDSEDKS